MSRSLKYEIPGFDPRLSLADVTALGWDAIFAKSRASQNEAGSSVRPLVLEIGFGRGEFLLALADRSPEADFVGIEISFKRTLKMARKVARAKLDNVRLLEARAQVVLSQLFLPGTLSEIWLNFSDPWPKARHAHRRLVRPEFVVDVATALEPGGVFCVATDDVRYAHQIDEVLTGEKSLFNQYRPWPYLHDVPGRLMTGYETQWRSAGRPMHFFAYSTTPRDDGP
jgi:tRNA (guanine-N7-)-methyltransferase